MKMHWKNTRPPDERDCSMTINTNKTLSYMRSSSTIVGFLYGVRPNAIALWWLDVQARYTREKIQKGDLLEYLKGNDDE